MELKIKTSKLYTKYEKSTSREEGIEVGSSIRGLKYIIKGNSLILSTVGHGVFAIDIRKINELSDELNGIANSFNPIREKRKDKT